MKQEIAAEVLKRLASARGELNEGLRTVQQHCEEDEFKRFRREIGKLMGALFLDVVGPIYKEHPTLIPPEMNKTNSHVGQHKKTGRARP